MDQAEDLICPIGCEILNDPVKAEDGFSYSRGMIEAWFQSRRNLGLPITSPMTRAVIGERLESDELAAEAVRRWLQRVVNPGQSPDMRTMLAVAVKRMLQKAPDAAEVVDMRTMLAGTASIHDLRKCFATLDELRPILLDSLKGWQPPQIVVIGQESSGKSSVLERLAMLPLFPRDANICTRLPIHVRLRYAETCQPATLEVFNKATNQTEEGPYVIPTSTGFIDVREKMEEILKKEQRGALSTDRSIILKVHSPNVASIDLVDLPGLVTSPAENRAASRQLVAEHIQKHGDYSMFLATVDASQAPNTSPAMELVEQHRLQAKTVGVFTMCDEAAKVAKKWDNFSKRMDGQDKGGEGTLGTVDLHPHGWVAVVNAEMNKEKDVSSNFARLFLQASHEQKFLRQKMKAQVQKGRAGCGALVDKVNKLFMEFLARQWAPETVRKLDAAIQASKLDNVRMGEPCFHEMDQKRATQARALAVVEARKMLGERNSQLVQQCCRSLLETIRAKLIQASSSKLDRVPADKVCELWNEQHRKLSDECEKGVAEWGAYWAKEVKLVLEERTVVTTLASKPKLELWRFQPFIAKILANLQELMDGAMAEITDAVDLCLGEYYKEMSPFVSVACSFTTSPPTASISGQHTLLVDNIMLAFLRRSSDLLTSELPASLDQLAASLGPKEWVESCASQRVEVLNKIHSLEDAKARILSMVPPAVPS